VPAFLTLVLIPLTYSIANGLGFGVIAWAVLHLFAGKARRQDWLLYAIAALFLARFIYLGANQRGFAGRERSDQDLATLCEERLDECFGLVALVPTCQ
jgi:hypothetical protein